MKTSSSHINGSSLLTKLLNKGDQISIVQGKLLIKPSSGLEVPSNWLKQYEPLLINDICQLLNITALRYVSYTTGKYGNKKSPGITLQFRDLQTNEDAYIIYNAILKRTRNSKGGMKGDPLPNKQFIVSERSSFYKFWRSADLPLPRSLSKFYECMGKLKPLLFTGEVDFNNRITNKIVSLLEVSYQQILSNSNLILSGQKNSNLTAKEPLTFRQGTAKEPLSFTAKDVELSHTHNGLAPNQSACLSKCGNTVIRKEVIRKGISSDITPVNTLNNKEIEINIFGANLQKKQPEEQTTDEWLADWENASETFTKAS
jgi:hypothetical protein